MERLRQYIQDRIDALTTDRELADCDGAKAIELAIKELKGIQEELAVQCALGHLTWG